MKRIIIAIAAIILSINTFAQNQPKFTEEDAKQFYRTMQGDYSMQVNDSTMVMVHLTPIWENERFQWLYLEATQDKQVVLQKVIEITPKTGKTFHVLIHSLNNPKQFEGKWANRNFFDGFGKNILSRGTKLTFIKTKDFSYQMNDFKRIRALECFPDGDILHIKFVQEDERFYIKRVPKGTTRILGYEGLKELTD